MRKAVPLHRLLTASKYLRTGQCRLLSSLSRTNMDVAPSNTTLDTSGETKNAMDGEKKIQYELEQARTSESSPQPEFPSDLDIYWKNSQERHAFRPKVDPELTSVVLFPGQGSQFVGMGAKLLPYPNVKEMYEVASDILGYDLLDVCLNGPKSKLDKTIYCQPAIMVTSLAAVEKLRDDKPEAVERCVGAAGFSIGEISSLVFADALSFENAVELVQVRAQAMQAASEATPGGMISVFTTHQSKLGSACQTAKEYCRKKLDIEDPVCQVANYLYPDCKVVAGNEEALEFIQTNAKAFGLRRIKRLPVSGAFHTKHMSSAKDAVSKALKKIDVQQPLIPVYSNLSSHWYRNVGGIKKMLPQQIHKPVKWEQIMHVVYSRKQGESFPMTYEVGPGRQLGNILEKINLKAYNNYHRVEV